MTAAPRPLAARATLRLAAVMALAVLALTLVAMVLTFRMVEARMMQGAQALLAADLDGFAAIYEQRRIPALREAIDYRAQAGNPGEMLLLLDKQGQALAGTLPGWPEGVARAGQSFSPSGAAAQVLGGERWLIVARDLPGGFPLLVGRSLQPVDATMAALRNGMLWLLLAILAASAGVGWLAARWVMGRIGRVNALADRVAMGDLEARLPGPRSDDEFGLLETHVHAMLDRIGRLNRETHRLADTIAHELRTPLNRMLQKLSRIEGQDDLTDSLRQEMRQAIRVFDSLLDISRAEADAGSAGLVPVDLSRVLAEVWDLYEPLAEDKGLLARAEIAEGARVLGDRTLIAQLLSNLLDNAIKYCRPGDALCLTLTAGADRHLMRLADTGPGLPPDLREDAFERFTRAERDRGIKGHGLGLALVRAIALRHGAKLTLPPAERGFVLEIGWPGLNSDG